MLLIDKPKGPTSHDIVNRVRRLLNHTARSLPPQPTNKQTTNKPLAVGHAGTLDPLATGLLVLLLGRATKLSDLFLKNNKQYQADIRLGRATTTWDAQDLVDAQGQSSEPCQSSEPSQISTQNIAHISAEQVLQQAQLLQNEKLFPLPVFSAVKHKGQRLHHMARRGLQPDTPILKPMSFYNLKNLHYRDGLLQLQMDCTKGSYVRAFAHVLGQKLGCGAHLENLRRLRSEPYSLTQAISLEQLQQKLSSLQAAPSNTRAEHGLEAPYFISLAQALQGRRQIFVRDYDRFLAQHGQLSYRMTNRLIVEQKQAQREGCAVYVPIFCAYSQSLMALAIAHPNKAPTIKPLRAPSN